VIKEVASPQPNAPKLQTAMMLCPRFATFEAAYSMLRTVLRTT
jgi:hypothetical protein